MDRLSNSAPHESNASEVDARNSNADESEIDDNVQQKANVTEIKNEIKRLELGAETDAAEIETDVATTSSASLTSKENATDMSEAGRFFLAAICAISLGQLFDEKWDAEFRSRSIKFILLNLQLPPRVEPLMLEFIKGEVHESVAPYLKLLFGEPEFEKRENLRTVVYDFIALGVHEGKYDARWRVLVQHIAKLFQVDRTLLDEFERQLVSSLLQKTAELSEEEKKKANNRRLIAGAKRYALIGLATIGGGALIGVTGGLVAPVIGANLINLLGASAVLSAFSGAVGATVVGSLFGVAGGGLSGYKMHKRVGDIEEFEFRELSAEVIVEKAHDFRQAMSTPKELHVTIVISGWIKNKTEENFTKPWSNLINGKEQYYLKYESSYLLELGKAMEYLVSCVASFATQEMLKYTVLSGIMSAVAWPVGLLGLASVIDNPWGVCLRRSAQVGKQLAEVLLARNQGHRPVTLLGYSLGARVIYYCLREMSERKNCEGIIQDVILIGAPCTAQTSEWTKFTRVVAGRIINGYCRGDWLLKFLYRTLSVAVDGVAGLQKIDLKNHKMHNVDLTDMVTGHSDYPEKMTEILSHIGVPLTKTKPEPHDEEKSSTLVDDSISLT